MDFTISEDLQQIQQTIRTYVRERLLPLSEQVEQEDRIPDEVITEMAAIGLFGVPFPKEYGGLGAGLLGFCLALEELGAANAAFANIVGPHVQIGAMAIYLDGSEEQKRKYMTDLATGRRLAAFALTEAEAGCDAANIQTTAVRRDDSYILNGRKQWISNGAIAEVFSVFAVTDKTLRAKGGITAFIVEKSYPGFRVGKLEALMGLRGSHPAELFFEDCVVPADNVLGREGFGFATAMKTLDVGRVAIGASAVGSAQRLLELCIDHSKQRVQFGRPIAANQAIQWMLADIATEIDAARWMTYHAAWKSDQGQRYTRDAAMVKLFTTDMLGRVADRAVQIFGGRGYSKEYPIERFYRDARILRIYEGTNEVQRLVIAGDLLKG